MELHIILIIAGALVKCFAHIYPATIVTLYSLNIIALFSLVAASLKTEQMLLFREKVRGPLLKRAKLFCLNVEVINLFDKDLEA